VDDFLHDRGLSEAEGNTWVVVPEPRSPKILAFYTIVPDPITDFLDDDFTETTEEFIEIAWLGVSVDHTGQYIGTKMLIRVIKQILLCAEDYQIAGLVLTALNDKAKAWYLHLDLGFQELMPGSRRLFLSIETMRQSPIASTLLEW
jgi:hypothetical protein